MEEFKGMPPDRGPSTRGEKAIVWAFGLAMAVLMAVGFLENFTPRMVSIPVFLVSWPVLLLLHEMGHAIAAKLLGWEVSAVAIGTGAVRSHRMIWGMPVEFRTIPLSGFARIRATDLIQPRLKNSLIYAAGPGIELIAVLICAVMLGMGTLLSLSDSLFIVSVQAFCVAALVGVVTNLIPFEHQTESGRAWSDGLGVIMSWRLPDSYFLNQIEDKD